MFLWTRQGKQAELAFDWKSENDGFCAKIICDKWKHTNYSYYNIMQTFMIHTNECMKFQLRLLRLANFTIFYQVRKFFLIARC